MIHNYKICGIDTRNFSHRFCILGRNIHRSIVPPAGYELEPLPVRLYHTTSDGNIHHHRSVLYIIYTAMF